MRIEPRFILAALLAGSAFVMAGGMQAAAQAVKAEEGRPAPAETSIPFVNMGGIRDWQAVDDSTLYVQDTGRKWYLARLMAPCTELPFATTIGFETKGLNQLDKYATVVVSGQRCPFSSFVASGPPPAKKKPGAK